MQFRIATRLTLLLIGASLIPLTLFGTLSLWQLRKATRFSVATGNANVSRRAAEEVEQYLFHALTLMESLAENINHADLKDWQKERILRNYVNRFDQFRLLTLRDLQGGERSTTRAAPQPMTPLEEQAFTKARGGGSFLSSVYLKEDLTPAMLAAFPVRRLAEVQEVLLAELNLLHMWMLVDSLKIGEKGVLHVIDREGKLLATGDGRRKQEVFQQRRFEPYSGLDRIAGPQGAITRNALGEKVLAVGVRLKEPLSWWIVVEQPTSEAFALVPKMTLLLASLMIVILGMAFTAGFYGGKKNLVDPIESLSRATEELARGNLDYRVTLATGDEFEQLAAAFNTMSRDLKKMQEKLVLEERHALFGRIASGLAHDLKHPVQAIETASHLMEQLYDDPEFRQTFQQTVKREFEKINRFLEDLHRLTHEIPFRPIPLRASRIVEEAVDTFRLEAERRNIRILTQLGETDDAWVYGDPHSLNRVFCNLIANALEAMEGGGDLRIRTAANGASLHFILQDTGAGIPRERLATLFDDFVTTKRKGLGLGLALVKKIVGQHRGEIKVASEPGRGTTMTLTFPPEGLPAPSGPGSPG